MGISAVRPVILNGSNAVNIDSLLITRMIWKQPDLIVVLLNFQIPNSLPDLKNSKTHSSTRQSEIHRLRQERRAHLRS
jgi:hypothetical protein